MKLNITAAAAILLFGTSAMTYADDNVQVVQALPTTTSTGLYTANRDPLAPSPLAKLPIGSIKPKGWLLHQLQLEADGMTGHLEELSPWCKFEGSAWSDPKGKGTNGWEEMPYWLKGYGDLGYVLNDKRIIDDARRWIEAALASQEADGWFGPQANKHSGGEAGGHADFWPNMLMLNVMQSYYEYSHDPRVLTFLTKYFRFQLDSNDADFSPAIGPRCGPATTWRASTGSTTAPASPGCWSWRKKSIATWPRWGTGVHRLAGREHLPGLPRAGRLFVQAAEQKFLDAAESNYQRSWASTASSPAAVSPATRICRARLRRSPPGIRNLRHGRVDAQLRDARQDRRQSPLGRPLRGSGLQLPARRHDWPTRRGSITSPAPTWSVCDTKNKSPGIGNGGTMFSYSPWDFRCCQHNVSHGWPYFAEELWHATADRGLCATIYAACDVTAKVGPGEGTTVQIAATTDYPFSDTVALKLTTPSKVRFPLYFRVPRWCEKPAVSINGNAAAVDAKPLSFIRIERDWQSGDTVEVKLPMAVNVRTWAKNKDSVSVDYGPLTFSLKIGERWSKFRERSPKWPEFELFPTTPWNYGLVLDAATPAGSFELVRGAGPLPAQPFTPETAPLELKAKARRIPGWTLDKNGLLNVLQPSPAKSSEPVEAVTLIPMGAARLRITSFPTIGDGPDAHVWVAPK